MLEEVKELVQLINSLPHLALWVMAGFWVYKVVMIGSIYGLIHFAIDKMHDWLVKPKTVVTEWKFRNVRLYQPDRLESLLLGVINYANRSRNAETPKVIEDFFYIDSMHHLQKAWDEYTERNPQQVRTP